MSTKQPLLCNTLTLWHSYFLQPIKEELEDKWSWFELDQDVGVPVIDDEQEEEISQKDEEDSE